MLADQQSEGLGKRLKSWSLNKPERWTLNAGGYTYRLLQCTCSYSCEARSKPSESESLRLFINNLKYRDCAHLELRFSFSCSLADRKFEQLLLFVFLLFIFVTNSPNLTLSIHVIYSSNFHSKTNNPRSFFDRSTAISKFQHSSRFLDATKQQRPSEWLAVAASAEALDLTISRRGPKIWKKERHLLAYRPGEVMGSMRFEVELFKCTNS